MANVELGSSNLKEVYDAINSNSGTIDTTNLAKLNEGNIFKEGCTFEKDCLFGGQAVIGKLKSLSNPNVMTPKEWDALVDNDIPTKKQIVDITDTKVSKTGPETIEGVKTFASIPLCQQRPTNGNQLANKDYVDDYVNRVAGVTVDTEQTITGNKFFQATDGAEHFVKFYPTPKQIPIGGDTNSTYTAHLQGSILAGDTGGDEYNPKSLRIGVPTYSPLTFFGYSQGFGGVRFDSSDFGGQIGGVFYETTHNNNLYKCDGVSFISRAYSNSATFLVGHIQANNQNEYFDGTQTLENAILMESNDGLIFRVGDAGKIYVNDRAKSEFQRVLELPDMRNVAKLDGQNHFITTGSNTLDGTTNLNGETNVTGTLNVHSDTIEIGKATTGGLTIQTADNSVTMNLADTCTLTVQDKLKEELKRELEVPDTSNLAKLDQGNAFTGVQTFNSNVNINGTLDTGDVNLRGNTTFYSNSIFKNPLVVANNTANQELAITPILNGVSINLGDDCTLTMNPKMISELKRLLGIQ